MKLTKLFTITFFSTLLFFTAIPSCNTYILHPNVSFTSAENTEYEPSTGKDIFRPRTINLIKQA